MNLDDTGQQKERTDAYALALKFFFAPGFSQFIWKSGVVQPLKRLSRALKLLKQFFAGSANYTGLKSGAIQKACAST